MLYSGGPFNVILSGGHSQGEMQIAEPDYGFTRNFFLLTYMVSAGLLFGRWKRTVRVIPYGLIIWALVGLAGLSYLWSDMPSETLTSTIGLIGTTLFGIYIATRYTPKEQLVIYGWGFGLIVVLSLIYGVLLPKYGVMGGVHAGAWRGIYTHKNTLGKMMTLSSTLFTLLILADRKNRIIASVFLGLSILLILLSTSQGALVNLILMLAVISVCWVLRAGYRWMVILAGSLLLVTGSIAAIILVNIETIVVDILEKDLTFTGRTGVWRSSLEVIQTRPWLGHGYEAFWNGLDGASAYVWRAEMWEVPDAHNGFIELMLHLGFVGLSVFIVGYLINIVGSILKVRNSSGVEFIWPLAYLVYLIPSNIYEQSFLKNDIFWVMYVTSTLVIFMPQYSEVVKSAFDSFSTSTKIGLNVAVTADGYDAIYRK